MLKELNPNVVKLPRSGIRVILDEANQYEDVIHLEIGQPDLPTPSHIVEAAYTAARDGYTGYTANAGYLSLREAFADRLFKDKSLKIDPDQIVVTVGAMGAIFSAMCVTLSAGDEVLVPDPGYPNYIMPPPLFGAEPIPYPLNAAEGFLPDVEVIRSLITDRSKVIIINSPSNPTGAVIPAELLQKIVDISQQYGLYIISDESYDQIIFDCKHTSCLEFDKNGSVIAVFSCSKTYSMTGWRIGFAVSNKTISSMITKMQEIFIACAPSVSQKAAEAALTGPQVCVEKMVETYRHRRDTAIEMCKKLDLNCKEPKGAFYLMVSLSDTGKHNSMEYALRLVREARLAVSPGITFGSNGEGFVRVSLCTSEENIKEGLKRLANFQIM